METEVAVQPDAEIIDWLKHSYSVRRGRYFQWRDNVLVPEDSSISVVHDAWLSTVTDSEMAAQHAPVMKTYRELDYEQKALCILTAMDIRESIYEHAQLEPEPRGRQFDAAFVYRAMTSAYLKYYDFTGMMKYMKANDSVIVDGTFMIQAEGSQYFKYGEQSQTSKEVDRRMVMATMVDLENPDSSLCEPAIHTELMALDNVQRAIADGKAILHSVAGGPAYNPAQAFAAEVTQWRV